MSLSVGSVTMAIGGLHTALGLGAFADVWGNLAKAGLLNSIGGSHERSVDNLLNQATLWFTYSGLLMGTTGLAIYHLEQETDELPLSISLSLVAAALGVVVFIPESGGWLLLFPAYLAYKKRRKEKKA